MAPRWRAGDDEPSSEGGSGGEWGLVSCMWGAGAFCFQAEKVDFQAYVVTLPTLHTCLVYGFTRVKYYMIRKGSCKEYRTPKYDFMLTKFTNRMDLNFHAEMKYVNWESREKYNFGREK